MSTPSGGGRRPPGDASRTDEADLASFAVRSVPFDEWVDIDTLVHRSSVTSGDFDYVLRPLCAECGAEADIEYEMLDLEGEGVREVIAAIVCVSCKLLWEPDQPDD